MIHPINATAERPSRAVPVGMHEIPVGMHRRLAHVRPGLTPLAVRAEHLQLVSVALTQAGVEHFVVPGTEDTSSAIGVRDTHRGRVAQTLRSLFGRSPGYIQRRVPVQRTSELLHPGARESSWQGLETVDVLRAIWFQADPSGELVYGTEYGCDIEFWREEEGRLLPPRINRGASFLPVEGEMTLVSPHRFSRLAPPLRTEPVPKQRRWSRKPEATGLPTRREFVCTGPDEITFPIDVVYTWVDSDDPAWQRRRAEASGDVFHEESASAGRYINRDELLYSMRSLHMYAPWVRHIYLVTDDQVPHWLDETAEGITVVSHREIFRETDRLPVFNSHAISAQLHRVPGLSEHFIHFNDDVFVGRPITPHEFFLPNGASKYYPDTVRIPMGPVRPDDLPHEVARKNVRALLEGRFGRTIIDAMKHTPVPLRRSVLEEMEREFAEVFRATAAARFRSRTDIDVGTCMYPYYSYFTERGVPDTIPYAYLHLSMVQLSKKLDRLLKRRDAAVFCVNDSFSTEDDVADQEALIHPFFEAYFPLPSPYEKTATR